MAIGAKANVIFPSLALTAMLIHPLAQAQDEPVTFDFYGKINVSLQSNDLDDGTPSDTEIISNASRFGIKGGAQLDGDLEVIYQLEWEVDVADLGGDDNIKARNQFIGLKGNFGEFTVGRRDTALKLVQSGFDPFSNYAADMKHIFAGKNRTKNTLSYFSPKFNQFQVAASYVFAEDDFVDDGISLSLAYGDKKLKQTQFHAAIAVDDSVNGRDIVRAMGMTKVGDTQLGLLWQDQENVDGTGQADGWVANVIQPWQNFSFKFQYQMMDFDDGEKSAIAAGADYKLGDNTTVYAWYTGRDLDNIDAQQRYLAIGIEHKF
ncbi:MULTISPECIES: porin [Idiomarina]|uniref:porin n=1 Tax=Idiomarina TaxID=135575 RepID=UPI00129ACE51|nr:MULTISPECIES: porin [Idiomarina]MRJ41568.1 porin [Idiomarina sp. FeN1]NCU57558.1 porin [Idiomarina sp. FenA--70]NCU60110.1 porin [Idiomarina sp. FenBw--71]UUN13794.1 porin [Idiomarina loihiensis]